MSTSCGFLSSLRQQEHEEKQCRDAGGSKKVGSIIQGQQNECLEDTEPKFVNAT